MKTLVPSDFKSDDTGDVVHGWAYEDNRYTVSLTLCWDGCDVRITLKGSGNKLTVEHVPKPPPSFEDSDVKAALAIANILIQNYELGGH